MSSQEHLLLAGASVRAAAFSAVRAGLRPWCVDLFADADLAACCPTQALAAARYPQGLVEVFRHAPPGPWMYTGGLENRQALVGRLSRGRILWGNGPPVLQRVRDPLYLFGWLREVVGLPGPAVRRVAAEIPRRGRWLVKPIQGAGGRSIRFLRGGMRYSPARWYFQQYVEGEPCAAIYLGDGPRTQLLGVTRQLVGEEWLHAATFHYCGSIGPLRLAPSRLTGFGRLGTTLAEGLGLRGLFGVDCVVRRGVPYPVEVNPRYTASVELLEHASGTSALALHRRVFEPGVEVPSGPSTTDTLGKAVLFARRTLDFPADGPWTAALRRPGNAWELPAFADLPRPGTRIEAGRPVLTFFARGTSVPSCLAALRQTATDLDRWLYR